VRALRLLLRLLRHVGAVRLLLSLVGNGRRQTPPLRLLRRVGALRLLLRLVSNDGRETPPLRRLAVQEEAGGNTDTVHLSSLWKSYHMRGPSLKTRRYVRPN
jgi:hypothetical protein